MDEFLDEMPLAHMELSRCNTLCALCSQIVARRGVKKMPACGQCPSGNELATGGPTRSRQIAVGRLGPQRIGGREKFKLNGGSLNRPKRKAGGWGQGRQNERVSMCSTALDVGAERLGLPTNNYILQKGGRLTVNKILITLAATLAATVTDTSWTYPETEAMKHTSAIVRLLYTGEKREVLKLATSKATSAKNGKRNDVEGRYPAAVPPFITVIRSNTAFGFTACWVICSRFGVPLQGDTESTRWHENTLGTGAR
ncbi:hypothetical protein DFH94DRAFT_848216 [Russula ochroleuca]|uniref:Uncharacterized protein n=1 Tax=Russula ochroleuca TaxID=152965 RepID=A0A9P5MP45_9AGAM|nr:hypothetical protein DFH94DRAFT_848216 [Russula ochroleuca]